MMLALRLLLGIIYYLHNLTMGFGLRGLPPNRGQAPGIWARLLVPTDSWPRCGVGVRPSQRVVNQVLVYARKCGRIPGIWPRFWG